MKRALSFFFVALVVAACGGGSSGGSSGAIATDSSSFTKQYCDLIGGNCCPKIGKTYNATSCQALFALAGNGGTYDPGAGSSCLSALQTASASANFCDSPGSDANTKTACNGVYKTAAGTGKQPGAECANSSECASSPDGDVTCATTFNSNNSETKTCRVSVRAKEGDPCNGTKKGNVTSYSGTEDPARIGICWDDDQLYCQQIAGTNGAQQTYKCAKYAAIGAVCSGSGPTAECVSGAYCDSLKTKTCVADAPVGADCGGTTFATCIDAAYCDQTSKKCVAALAVGAACTTSTECGTNNSCVNNKCQAGGLTTLLFYCAN
jgi:hypothetical protein